MNQSIKLQTTSILHVPLNNYEKDFTFIVNGKEFQTTKVIADLLSPKISNSHLLDPTISHIIINTRSQGNFQRFLNLQKFELENISSDELLFFGEIIEQLGTENVDINIAKVDITIDNVLNCLLHDFPFRHLYSQQIEEEIEFISKNFIEIEQNQQSSLLNLPKELLSSILSNPNLVIESEDKLLNFINELYLKSNEYSILYEYILFANVQSSSINDFLTVFDFNDLNSSSWHSISNRLKQKVNQTESFQNSKRYKFKETKSACNDIKYTGEAFNGIFNYFRKHSNIQDEVKITASSVGQGNIESIVQINSPNLPFNTQDKRESWVCFEFINHKVALTNYTIRSNNWGAGSHHLKSWVIEGSKDKQKWDIIDDVKNCSFLNGSNYVHTFSVQNQNKNEF